MIFRAMPILPPFASSPQGHAALLRKIRQWALIARQRAIDAAGEEMLRMHLDVGEMLRQSRDADGQGKKTLQRLAADQTSDYSKIEGFSVRNMQCMMPFFNEYNQGPTMVYAHLLVLKDRF